ncbi:angiopoietin-related protein 3-like isoform X2 [Artibeus jamaicensis]|uniref:angiopoietin-related protein 3-like isoform X2 n=1 Tax=Artibeus jamaicensis TaxID=9417 RepID=UPI00235ACD8A|nr:angiopoietin-related protein 3-like isoform X2 [Artibeus jamaicensis]
MKKASVWFLLSLAYSLSSAKKQRECHAPATYSQDDINILSQGLLQLGMELKMQVSNSKNHTGHLFKQLDTLNTSLVELLTQVSRQERKGEDLERRAEQLDRRSEGLRQLVAELQHQLVVGIQCREKLSERLELLERKMEDAVLLKADGLSLTQVMDAIMVKSKPKPTKESVKTGNKKNPTHP